MDRHLGLGSLPRGRRIFPARLNVTQHQPDELGGRLLAGKMAADSHRLADLRVEALDGIGGVKDFSQLGSEGEERNHLLPIAPPALREGGIFLPPRAAVEMLESLERPSLPKGGAVPPRSFAPRALANTPDFRPFCSSFQRALVAPS